MHINLKNLGCVTNQNGIHQRSMRNPYEVVPLDCEEVCTHPR